MIAGLWLKEDEGEVLVFSDRGMRNGRLLRIILSRGGRQRCGHLRVQGREAGAFEWHPPDPGLPCEGGLHLNVVLEDGEIHKVDTEQVPIEERRSFGKQVVPLTKDQQIQNIVKL